MALTPEAFSNFIRQDSQFYRLTGLWSSDKTECLPSSTTTVDFFDRLCIFNSPSLIFCSFLEYILYSFIRFLNFCFNLCQKHYIQCLSTLTLWAAGILLKTCCEMLCSHHKSDSIFQPLSNNYDNKYNH